MAGDPPGAGSKPATYRCPLCGYDLHATTAHSLIAPEGDAERRLATRLQQPSLWRRLLGKTMPRHGA